MEYAAEKIADEIERFSENLKKEVWELTHQVEDAKEALEVYAGANLSVSTLSCEAAGDLSVELESGFAMESTHPHFVEMKNPEHWPAQTIKARSLKELLTDFAHCEADMGASKRLRAIAKHAIKLADDLDGTPD